MKGSTIDYGHSAKGIHAGLLIKTKVFDSGMSVTKFAELINCERTNVYHIFKRKNIDIELLDRISKALKYNFLSDIYPQMHKKSKECLMVIRLDAEKKSEVIGIAWVEVLSVIDLK